MLESQTLGLTEQSSTEGDLSRDCMYMEFYTGQNWVDGNWNGGCLWEKEAWKGEWENFWAKGHVLYLDLGGGFMNTHGIT